MTRVAFGTDGVRGTAGDWPVVPDVARSVGRATARLGRRVLLGRDPRPSGDGLVAALADGVVEEGGLALDAGVVPTAALQVALAEGLGDAAVMVTASHNPEDDNGFKVLGAGGRKPDDALAAQLEAWIALDSPPCPGGSRGRVDVESGWRRAVAARAGDLAVLRGRRIAVDLANGAALGVRGWLGEVAPAELVWLGTDGPVNDGCGTEHLGHLARAVVRERCDGGFAVDGDADRCRLVDERGAEVPGDAITWLLARALAVSGLAATVMSNGALERALPGVRVVRTPVGDRHLREAMDREGLGLGAEESGHVLFADHPGGDGVLCGLRALGAAFAAEATLSGAFRPFVPLPRRLAKLAVRARAPLEEVEPVVRARAEALGGLGSHGRVFLRYSGTEPVLRILVEGEPAEAVDAAADRVMAACREALG